MQTITRLSAISPVNSATQQNRGRDQSQHPFVRGQLLQALVVESRGDNRFILDIGGNRLTAWSEATLSPGQSLRLEVVDTSPEVVLKIVADTAHRFSGRSLTLLGKNLDISSLYQALEQHTPSLLQSLPPAARNILENYFTLQQQGLGSESGGKILRQLIENLGLNLEKLLAAGDKGGALRTLKAALLSVAKEFQGVSPVAEKAATLATTLELFQLIQAQPSPEAQVTLPLPLSFIEQGFLIIEGDSESVAPEQGGGDAHRLSLHLTMTEIGNLRVDFLYNSDGLYLRFYADSQAKADFMAGCSEDLKSSLSKAKLAGLTFTGDAGNPASELVRKIVGESGSMLDTRV